MSSLSAGGDTLKRLWLLLGVLAAAVDASASEPQVHFSPNPTVEEISKARVFAEPLVPIGGSPSAEQNLKLAQAITAYQTQGNVENVSSFTAFLNQFPTSPWRAALLTDLGIVYRRTGHFSRALTAWEAAWEAAKGQTEPRARAIADRALGELAELNARLGRYERLEALFAETEGRDLGGAATERIAGAKQGLWLMRNQPQDAFRCGPMALDRILAYGKTNYIRDLRIIESQSSLQGMSLLQVRDLANQLGMHLRMAKRAPGSAVRVPAVVHWKAGHFAALVDEKSGHYVIQDPTFGEELLVSHAALNDEASGYFLVADGALPAGWTSVSDAEGGAIWGKGNTSGPDPEEQGPRQTNASGCCEGKCGAGMAAYTVNAMIVSLHLTDTPLGYQPPRGPAVQFTANYNQRDAFQPQIFTYASLASKWTFDWLSYVEDDPSNPAQSVTVYKRGGGRETFTGYDSGTSSYAIHVRSRAVLVRTQTSPITYERRLPDGSKEVFGQADGNGRFPAARLHDASGRPAG
jgi:hypothetical protein